MLVFRIEGFYFVHKLTHHDKVYLLRQDVSSHQESAGRRVTVSTLIQKDSQAADFGFEDCIIDLTALGHDSAAAMVSQLDGNWCSTPGAAVSVPSP